MRTAALGSWSSEPDSVTDEPSWVASAGRVPRGLLPLLGLRALLQPLFQTCWAASKKSVAAAAAVAGAKAAAAKATSELEQEREQAQKAIAVANNESSCASVCMCSGSLGCLPGWVGVHGG